MTRSGQFNLESNVFLYRILSENIYIVNDEILPQTPALLICK